MKKICAILALSLLPAGCAVSPSVPILGAFFPGWLLCLTGALFLTLIIRAVLGKLGRVDIAGPPVIAYPLITAAVTLLLWIVFFQN